MTGPRQRQPVDPSTLLEEMLDPYLSGKDVSSDKSEWVVNACAALLIREQLMELNDNVTRVEEAIRGRDDDQ